MCFIGVCCAVQQRFLIKHTLSARRTGLGKWPVALKQQVIKGAISHLIF